VRDSGRVRTPAQLFDLTGKVALVTGATRGLGKEMTLALAAAGADVVVSSRKPDACAEVAAIVNQETRRRALPYAANVSRWDACTALVDAAYQEFGRVDVLVNNAGASPLYDDVAALPEELFDKMIGLNLKGPFRLCALVGSRMAAGDGGSIINVSSYSAVAGEPHAIPYAAAKAGLHNMTTSFAGLFGPTVRVNVLMPGAFATDVTKAWTPEVWEGAKRLAALGRVGEPHEVVGAVLYLASDASSFTTGTVLGVHGGAGAYG
jgi:NAD(P)-dependent dehydrogenase (short-subunit alcohol dehydrogenase family)